MFKINDTYKTDILNYCKVNNIEDVQSFINKCFKQGFDIKKYGLLDGSSNDNVIEVIKEVIVEIEKPIEVIKEVIIEKEKPIDVIREVIVEKLVPFETIKEVVVEKLIPVETVKEIIVEKLIEVQSPPVEVKVIEYVDREIKVEVPVEKIVYISGETKINEVIVEKIIEVPVVIHNKDKENELLLRIKELENRQPEIIEKTIEIIKEIEVEKTVEIIKEIEVEKIVEVIKEIDGSNTKQKMLENTLQKLREELSTKNKKIEELEEKNKHLESINTVQNAVYLKGSNLSQKM